MLIEKIKTGSKAGSFLAVVGFVVLKASTAQASGFDNTGMGSLDLLFDPAKFAVEFSYTYIDRNVDYKAKNAYTVEVTHPGTPDEDIKTPTPIRGGVSKARATPNVWNYAASAKFAMTDNIDCLARVNNPGSIEEVLPDDWLGRHSIIETDLQTTGLDATCSFKIPIMSGGFFRLIGGARHIEVDIFSKKIGLFDVANAEVSGSGFGWRAGAAFEYPEYAIRAYIVYDSAIDIELDGSVKTSALGFDLDLATTSQVTMPQGIEFRVQSGIAPKWLVFAGAKWVNWSVLQKLHLQTPLVIPGLSVPEGSSLSPVRNFNFTDGWTVTAGIGHQLTEKIQVGSSLTWDQGIGTSYSDTYSLGLGGAYQINDNVKISLGGVAAYKTGASNRYPHGQLVIEAPNPDRPDGVDRAHLRDHLDLSYDPSWNFGVGAKLKLSF